LHQGEAKTRVSFRLRGMDSGTNWREPSQTRIVIEVKGRFRSRICYKKKLHDPLEDRAALICDIPCRVDSV
jgi:hypothetical protein